MRAQTETSDMREMLAACQDFPVSFFFIFPQLGLRDFPTNPRLQAPKHAAQSASVKHSKQ